MKILYVFSLLTLALPAWSGTLKTTSLENTTTEGRCPFSLEYYVKPLLEEKGEISILEIGPSDGQEILKLFSQLQDKERKNISYDGVELWLEEEPKGITILKEDNPGQIQYFPGQDIFTFNPQRTMPRKKYDLIYAKAIPLGWGQRGVDLFKHLNLFLNPGAQFVILHSNDWYQGPLKQPSEEDLRKSVYILKKSLSKLGFVISEVNCSLPCQVQEQRARNEKLFCSQETIEKACVIRAVEDFLGNDLDAEDLEESLKIPDKLIKEVKESVLKFERTKEYLRNLRPRQAPRRISLSPSVIQQLKECSLTPAMILHLKECINLQKKPWKDLSLVERRELFYKISGTSIDLIAPRVILQKVEKE